MEIKNRAMENFPSVLLTLLSIVQAIALEEMWQQLQASLYLYEASWASLLGWFQIGLSLLTVILIWLLYVDLAMRVRFTPTVLDTTLPFFVGLVEFLLMAMARPETLGEWTMVLAALLALVGFINHKTMRRARQNTHNEALFKNIPQATKRDILNRGFFIVTFLLLGILLMVSGDQRWIALLTLLVITGRLTFLLRVISRFWRISSGDD